MRTTFFLSDLQVSESTNVVGVWLEAANAGQMLSKAARHFHTGGTGCGVYKLIGFRLLKEAFFLPSPAIV